MADLVEFEPVLRALVQSLTKVGVEYRIIGALVPELLLSVAPAQRTLDVDVVLLVKSLEVFEQVKEALRVDGFQATNISHRLKWEEDGGVVRLVDLLPYDRNLVNKNVLELEDSSLNVPGFDKVAEECISITLEDNLQLHLIPLPLYALLKIAAYKDRRAEKDLAGVLHCLRFYENNSDRCYGLEHAGVLVLVELASAFLLGADGQTYLTGALESALRSVMALLTDPDSELIMALAVREEDTSEQRREEIVELFRWFCKGLGVDA